MRPGQIGRRYKFDPDELESYRLLLQQLRWPSAMSDRNFRTKLTGSAGTNGPGKWTLGDLKDLNKLARKLQNLQQSCAQFVLPKIGPKDVMFCTALQCCSGTRNEKTSWALLRV